MKNLIFIILLFITEFSFSQDVSVSLGPVPLPDFNLTREPEPFQVGTRAFTQLTVNGTSFQVGRSFLEGCTVTIFENLSGIPVPGGLMYRNGFVYTWNQSPPYQLWMIDTVTGMNTFMFNITQVPQTNLTGMYWDGTNVYGVSTDLIVSQIFTVNMNTGVCTPIGTPQSNCAGAIFLTGRYGMQYSAFSVDIVLDNLYKWNKTTGIASLVGPLGVDANFSQDACFDNTDYKLYWACNTAFSQLRTIDTATGTAGPVLCSYSSTATGICCPVQAGPPLLHDYAAGPFLGSQSSYQINVSTQIKARITNSGQSNETSVPVKFFVDGSQVGSSINLSLNSGQNDSVSFPWTPTVGGSHNIRILTALATDMNRGNDTVSANVLVLAGNPGNLYDHCRNGLNKSILSNFTLYDTIFITLLPTACYIADVNVKIDTVIHTWDSDLQFSIIHHGVEVNIIDHVGSSGDNFIHTVLNDSASIPIASGTAPFTGTYRPSFPLTALNGFVPYAGGPWILKISNSVETGTLKAWCLTLIYFLCNGGIQTITVPNYYALGQNYPNPFNPSTKIEYAIPRPGDTKIIVYDILGRQVAVLVNEFKNPGIYTVDFDASQLSSGVYFYKMESGSFKDVKKMLVVK